MTIGIIGQAPVFEYSREALHELHMIMVSVDNFYWILHENLLKPSFIEPVYYFPFGTRDYLVEYYFEKYRRRDHHVFFHDQEPLWHNHLAEYDQLEKNYSKLKLRILANSEKSQLKNNICRDRGMLDWYYFYHGFAALDWFRDAEYLRPYLEVQYPFLSLNHLIQEQRSYRIGLLARLSKLDLLERGLTSFHGTVDDIKQQLSHQQEWSPKEKDLIAKQIERLTNLPLYLDLQNAGSTMSACFGLEQWRLWQKTLVHVVAETVFYDRKLHLTEKVFKPIVGFRPFILLAAPGNLAYLRTYGFQTFDQWIDESYDNVIDPEQRLDAVCNELKKICALSPNQLTDLYNDMMPVLQFNHQHFFGKFREIIVDELVENFDACLNQWNNGRVDGRNLPIVSDLKNVKKILLR